MTKLFPAARRARAPLGSAVTWKSRIERYFASFSDACASDLRAARRAISDHLASGVPRSAGLWCAATELRGARVYRTKRLGLRRVARASVRKHADEEVAAGRVARIRCTRDQRLVLHADKAGDLRALVRGDARRISVRAQGPSVRHALQAASRLPRSDPATARSGGTAGRD